jgi:hypothetical protein
MDHKTNRDEMGHAFESIEKALDRYATAHLDNYKSKIGEDAVIGDAWLRVLRGALGLLDGETGYVDPGRAWQRLVRLAKAHGFTDKEIGL